MHGAIISFFSFQHKFFFNVMHDCQLLRVYPRSPSFSNREKVHFFVFFLIMNHRDFNYCYASILWFKVQGISNKYILVYF
jgi:hypothetical protein